MQIKTKQFYDHIVQKLVKTGKCAEINKISNVKFWLEENMELFHIHLAVCLSIFNIIKAGHALGIWICVCILFYKRELWASKSTGNKSRCSFFQVVCLCRWKVGICQAFGLLNFWPQTSVLSDLPLLQPSPPPLHMCWNGFYVDIS